MSLPTVADFDKLKGLEGTLAIAQIAATLMCAEFSPAPKDAVSMAFVLFDLTLDVQTARALNAFKESTGRR